jgi:hypothetical protein
MVGRADINTSSSVNLSFTEEFAREVELYYQVALGQRSVCDCRDKKMGQLSLARIKGKEDLEVHGAHPQHLVGW